MLPDHTAVQRSVQLWSYSCTRTVPYTAVDDITSTARSQPCCTHPAELMFSAQHADFFNGVFMLQRQLLVTLLPVAILYWNILGIPPRVLLVDLMSNV